MKKSKSNALKFEALLEASGAAFDHRFAEFEQGYASTSKYNFRYSCDELEIGLKANFDKWGNSQDFVCRPLPCSQENFDALFAAIRAHITEKREAPEYGGIDIWPFVRKERRVSRNAARIAGCRERHINQNRICDDQPLEPAAV